MLVSPGYIINPLNLPNSVSQAINNQTLFSPNKPNSMTGGGKSLVTQSNPFLQSNTPSQTSLFGQKDNNPNNTNNDDEFSFNTELNEILATKKSTFLLKLGHCLKLTFLCFIFVY